MAWEQVEKQSPGRGVYGKQWTVVPAVAIAKNHIAFNDQFVRAFLGGRMGVIFFIDRTNRRLGIKVPGAQDEGNAYRVRFRKGNNNGTTETTCKVIAKSFPDAIGHAYRAHMNAGERIIEVDISPSNMLQ